MNKIQNFSISVDIPLRENSNKLKHDLNSFISKHNLQVNLGKDVILKK